MNRKKIFIVLGADNVGKTTLMNKSMGFVQDVFNIRTGYHHFSAPKPGETPLQMYLEALDSLQNMVDEHRDFIYVDRAWPESKFYELERRGKFVSWNEMLCIENHYYEFAKNNDYDISFNLMVKPWEFVEKFHIQELEVNRTFAEHSAIINNEPIELSSRKLEHGKYYRFMMDYQITREMKSPEIAINFPWNNIDIRDLDFLLI